MEALTGPIKDGWQELPLSDVCEIVAGPSNSILRQDDVNGVPIEMVAPKQILHRRIVGSSTVLLSRDVPARLERYRLRSGDLVCVRTGDLEKQALVGPDQEHWVTGTGCFRLRPGSTIDPRYLLHYLSHPAVRNWTARHASTATVPTLTISTLRTLPVLVPPPATQARIGDIMATLDEKAALHREIVDATEQLHDSLMPLLLTNG